MSRTIYLNTSNQNDNVGVGTYGTEAFQMDTLKNLTAQYIKNGCGDIVVYQDNPTYTLSQSVTEANNLNVERFLAFHSNAGGGKGTETFHYPNSIEGFNFAKRIYDRLAPVSISSDRGVKEADFYVLRETSMIACLFECMFHDNIVDVTDFLNNINKFALAIAKGIYDEFGIEYKESKPTTVSGSKRYQCITGLFSVEENAKKRIEALKNAGFTDAYYKEV
jgi:N-acetylmuramoyl-L-alanine amidase